MRLQGTWTDGRTDGQTGWFLYTRQTLFVGGIITVSVHLSVPFQTKYLGGIFLFLLCPIFLLTHLIYHMLNRYHFLNHIFKISCDFLRVILLKTHFDSCQTRGNLLIKHNLCDFLGWLFTEERDFVLHKNKRRIYRTYQTW